MRKHPVESLRDGPPAQLIPMVNSWVAIVEDAHEAVSFGREFHLEPEKFRAVGGGYFIIAVDGGGVQRSLSRESRLLLSLIRRSLQCHIA